MESTKRILWSNDCETIENIEKDIRENPDGIYDIDENTDTWGLACDLNNDYLSDTMVDLNKPIGNMVMIARVRLWNGSRNGWKHVNGDNLADILSTTCGDYVTFYVEDGDIKCEDTHHDGTNLYTYRAIKPEISPWEFDELLAEGKDINDLTEKLGHYVNEIYGW